MDKIQSRYTFNLDKSMNTCFPTIQQLPFPEGEKKAHAHPRSELETRVRFLKSFLELMCFDGDKNGKIIRHYPPYLHSSDPILMKAN